MELKNKNIRLMDYNVGVVVGRFQVNQLHQGQKMLLEFVNEMHYQVIIFIGISRTQPTKRNPLSFLSRKQMIQKDFPNAIILPQLDNRSDEEWSKNLDSSISLTIPKAKAILYGGRDSFIPHYKGRFETAELESDLPVINASSYRVGLSKRTIPSNDFRAGVINSIYNRYPSVFPTVDVCAYHDSKILLAKKPSEDRYRFVGGFVDTSDEDLESAASREFTEETNGIISNLKYITSMKVDDWRYRREEDGIMTTFFMGEVENINSLDARDDISELKWFFLDDFTNTEFIGETIMPEHQPLLFILLNYFENKK